MSRTVLQGGRVIDPGFGLDRIADITLEGGKVGEIGEPGHQGASDAAGAYDARGCVVCPGLVDLGARLREPGATRKGTIASETAAAAAGGITTLCCPPDTDPAVDTPATVELIRQRARASGKARVHPLGALTRGLEGAYLAPMGALAQAGCVALGQAGRCVADTHVLRAALAYAATQGLTVMLPPRDPALSSGCAHEGAMATRLGLAAVPVAAEATELARLIELARDTGAHVHATRLSSRVGVGLLEQAQRDGVHITADVAAHQLALTDHALEGFDSRAHLEPPLRSAADREALRRGVAEGVIGAICSDHQPHEDDAKRVPFAETAAGLSGLETLLPLALELSHSGVCDLATALARVTAGPAEALGLAAGTLAPGEPADVCVFQPDEAWTLQPAAMVSRGRNTPFAGTTLTGRVRAVWLGGEHVHQAGE